MSRRLTLATFASETVMGAQAYERAIGSHAVSVLGSAPEQWRVQNTIVRSMRSPLPGTRRVPVGWVQGASAPARSALARVIYPRSDLVHRMKIGLPPAPGRDVITLHDAGPWRFDDEARGIPAAETELRRARAVVTVSAFSAGEIAELFGVSDPVVIHNGIDRDRFAHAKPLAPLYLESLGIVGEYVLTAGGASKRKNLEGLAEAWPKVRSARPKLSLVLAGPEHPRRTALFKDMAGVVLAGRVSDTTLPDLMAGARAMVIPSLYEGFGLPALEAMVVGVPVVAMRASSLPEVIGDAGVLVDPTPQGLAEGIVWATSGDSDLDALVQKGKRRADDFSWERSARAHAALWQRLVSQ